MQDKWEILRMLKEEFERWEVLLSGLSIEQITDRVLPGGNSIKDVLGHLRAWQQRSIARLEAALEDRDPDYPDWPEDLDPDADDVDKINEWIQSIYGPQPWGNVYPLWKEGFLRFLEIGESIPEEVMFDTEKFPWLHGNSPADVMLGSYEHHHDDHYVPVLSWLKENGNRGA